LFLSDFVEVGMNGYKTIIGAAISILATVLAAAGVDLGTVDLPSIGNQLIAVIGGAIAIYGRVVATKKIGGGSLS